MAEPMFSTLYTRVTKKAKRHPRYYICQICVLFVLLVIFFTIFITIVVISFLLLTDKMRAAEESDISVPRTEDFSSKLQNVTSDYIYIDIGCYNGETIEHFLHFIPDSKKYDIIAFEPDPDNYDLCKQRLGQPKYANSKITILQKAVWIRNEKVSFRTNRGRFSRMITNTTMDDGVIEQLDAIDFSSWLADLAVPKKSKIYIKMSMPGAEISVLEKMVLDETLDLVDRYEIEWTDRQNPRYSSTRIYLQLMLDSYGFDVLHYTRLEDAQKAFKHRETYDNVTKYFNWRLINESDTFAHYKQRPDMFELPRKLNKKKW